MREQSAIIQDVPHTKQNKIKFLMLKNLMSPKFHAFLYKNDFMNVLERFALLSREIIGTINM